MIGEALIGVGAVMFGGCAVIAPAMFLREYTENESVLGGVYVVVVVLSVFSVVIGRILAIFGL